MNDTVTISLCIIQHNAASLPHVYDCILYSNKLSRSSSWDGEAEQNAAWLFLYIFNKDENRTIYKTRTVKNRKQPYLVQQTQRQEQSPTKPNTKQAT